MLVICLLSVLIAAALLWCIAAAAARASRYLEERTLVFLPPSAEDPFLDLLAAGDMESTFRILKALDGRGDVQIVESEREILITACEPLSTENRRRATVD
jgi:ABC-type sugar transport system substrate-binding protein